jgi:hypothetical protein
MTALFLIGVVVVLFSTWVLICYALIKYITGNIGRLTVVKWVTNKIMVIVVSFIVALLPILYWLFTSPAKNEKTAFIQQQESGFKVTVKGKRLLMVHDPVSWIFKDTYEDSACFIIPRQNGTINSYEIQVVKNNYKPKGTIVIDQRKMTIQLFYNQEQTSPDDWNGNYNLKLR